jgi:hypothetical protein
MLPSFAIPTSSPPDSVLASGEVVLNNVPSVVNCAMRIDESTDGC